MLYTNRLFQFLIISTILAPVSALAWGRRGHQIVAETAALVVSKEPKASFLRPHSFELGWYANVPDFGWKRPATVDTERPQHFMDMEIFDRAFAKHPEIKDPFALDRKDFEKAFPDVPLMAGRAFWRAREIYAELEQATKELAAMKPEADKKDRHAVQLRWMLRAGFLAHYIGDMAMPLHATENHNGEMTNQKNIHGYYEDLMVDQNYPRISCEVNEEATKRFPAFHQKNKDKSLLELLKDEANQSLKNTKPLLAMDKRLDRKNIARNAKAYEPMIREHITLGALYLAEIYSRQVGSFDFNDDKFYDIDGDPKYVPPAPGAESEKK